MPFQRNFKERSIALICNKNNQEQKEKENLKRKLDEAQRDFFSKMKMFNANMEKKELSAEQEKEVNL